MDLRSPVVQAIPVVMAFILIGLFCVFAYEHRNRNLPNICAADENSPACIKGKRLLEKREREN